MPWSVSVNEYILTEFTTIIHRHFKRRVKPEPEFKKSIMSMGTAGEDGDQGEDRRRVEYSI
jgi:hypothetical protein